MFCDVVDSTKLSSQLDPEDYRDVVRAYQRVCTEVVQLYEGYIAQYLGDGLLVYFGYPRAHEDDARRAVQAGVEIVTALQQPTVGAHTGSAPPSPDTVAGHAPLPVPIGIHHGVVVVGEIGDGG